MIDFTTAKILTIPEGSVAKITDASGNVLWSANRPIILTVEKITSNTYAAETTYENEVFILLDIYPKTNGTVSVTYGGLTKTITDTSGAASPNAQQVFFGTFNGVSDEVETPDSGTLTIEGDYLGFACGAYNAGSKLSFSRYAGVVTAVIDWGKMTSIGNYAFADCSSLTSITIPDSVTSIGSYAFSGCSSLTSITIPDSVTSIGSYAFADCSSLTSITIPDSVTSIGNRAFADCSSLTSITIPDSVTSIGNRAFSGCSSLTSIIVDSDNPVYTAENGVLFSKDKTVLHSYPSVSGQYTIPNSVASIGDSAFFEISSGATITVPDSVTSIGDAAFHRSGAPILRVIMLSTAPPAVGSNVFSLSATSTGIHYNDVTVPAGCGDAYKSADGWSNYADIITEAT